MKISTKDETNTLHAYETTFILRSGTQQDGISLVNARVRNAIEQLGGKVLKLENWGKRKLAYEIKKELKGIYMHWYYLGSSGIVSEVERNLRLLEQVIRYYTIGVGRNLSPLQQASSVDEDTYLKAASTVPDEEELATGTVSRFQSDDLGDDLDMEDYGAEFDNFGVTSSPREGA